MEMIENKVLQIHVIFKKYLKAQKIGQERFKFPNRLLFYKTSLNNFKKQFPITIF